MANTIPKQGESLPDDVQRLEWLRHWLYQVYQNRYYRSMTGRIYRVADGGQRTGASLSAVQSDEAAAVEGLVRHGYAIEEGHTESRTLAGDPSNTGRVVTIKVTRPGVDLYNSIGLKLSAIQ
jgi:hypothetical protein